MLYSPLEQFELIILCNNFIFFNNLHINFLLLSLVCGWFLYSYFNFFKNSLNYIFNSFFNSFLFIYKIVIEIIGVENLKNYCILKSSSLFYFIFFNILIFNSCGLFPYVFTVTSYLLITFFFACSLFIGSNLIGLLKKKIIFFNLFLPNNTPIILLLLLIPIEIISYVARVISLAVRLFANMMAGHTLLKILVGFLMGLITISSGVLLFSNSLLSLLVCCIIILEFLIAGLQAYVFILLAIIYYNDAILFNDH